MMRRRVRGNLWSGLYVELFFFASKVMISGCLHRASTYRYIPTYSKSDVAV